MIFTLFLLRMQLHPVDNYPIFLHPVSCENLVKLHDLLSNGGDDEIAAAFHRFLFSLLSHPSEQFLSNQWNDPFLRFLIAFHLQDDHGTFIRVILITPNLSKAQWAFRATAAREIELQKDQFKGDTFLLVKFSFFFSSLMISCIAYSTYQHIIANILTQKKPTMFNTLREQMGMITQLAYNYAGIPQFGWDPMNQTLSIHGHPLPMSRFCDSVHHVIDRVSNLIQQLFRSQSYQDILAYIDSRLDPSNPLKWFRDNPQNYEIGTSVFNEPNNGVEQYRLALLDHLVSSGDFFTVDEEGKLLPKFGRYFSSKGG
jgi:hypothetical protein